MERKYHDRIDQLLMLLLFIKLVAAVENRSHRGILPVLLFH